MRIQLTSIFVHDQEHARRFYTEVLGFRLQAAGVRFTLPPTTYEPGIRLAHFNDTCGNIIQLLEVA